MADDDWACWRPTMGHRCRDGRSEFRRRASGQSFGPGTHAHEDHLGAVHHLWERLRCPVWATPFTARSLDRKLAEANLRDKVPVTVTPLGSRFSIGPFDIESIALTHSIPEPMALAIRTPAGTVTHTGDWKLDPDPVVGGKVDEDALERLGDEGVLAIVCDSTNVLTPGTSGSEADLLVGLVEAIRGASGRGRHCCSNGRGSNHREGGSDPWSRRLSPGGRCRVIEAARETGYLSEAGNFIHEEDAGHLPKDKTLTFALARGKPARRFRGWRTTITIILCWIAATGLFVQGHSG